MTDTVADALAETTSDIPPPAFFPVSDGINDDAGAPPAVDLSAFTPQMQDVRTHLASLKLIPAERLDVEIFWFFQKLALNEYYYDKTEVSTIASTIVSIYAAKVIADAGGDSFSLRVQREMRSLAMYCVPSFPGRFHGPSEAVEYRLEQRYLREGYEAVSHSAAGMAPFRLQVYRSSGTVAPTSDLHLRLFFAQEPEFVTPPSRTDPTETDIAKIADKRFLDDASPNTHKIFQEALIAAQQTLGPVIRWFDLSNIKDGLIEARLVICYRHGSTHNLFSGITGVYHSNKLHSSRKYVEQFSNGFSIYSVYLKPMSHPILPDPEASSLEAAAEAFQHKMARVAEESAVIFSLPRTSLTPLFLEGKLTAFEVSYAYAAWKFAHSFCNSLADMPITAWCTAPLADHQSHRAAFTEGRVLEAMIQHVDLLKLLYEQFSAIHHDGRRETSENGEMDAQSKKIISLVRKTVTNDVDERIFAACLVFNRFTLKTNFYHAGAIALAFRFDPSFLSTREYPVTPFAVFFLVGSEFRGFHVRFADVARGGIRIIRSRNPQAFSSNVSTLFRENYALALTQQKKNKDIPEGGSKGTVLLSLDHQDKGEIAFKKYADALLDLMLLPLSQGTDTTTTEQPSSSIPQTRLRSKDIIDFSENQPEILFFGPDEGTADYMDWASAHARKRGATFWRGFTTGKSQSNGGIPHDTYGMTTCSVRQFVVGTLEKLGMDEGAISKVQTGGPDGDLGSNEIKIAKGQTMAVVDGSGVLYDPKGINRAELLRLANERLMSKHFDASKLSPEGIFVSVDDNDVKMPDGTLVESGLFFRNTFHLSPYASADLFVPCGGRPEAINMHNVDSYFLRETLADGTIARRPLHKVLIEGANLFVSPAARLHLEERGVVLFKDASTNKGGVTSSSLEVLAGLALSDAQYEEHMKVKDGKIPAFYEKYVAQVYDRIAKLARAEFECLWRAHEATGEPRSVLSDTLSNKINSLNYKIQESDLWEDHQLRKRIIEDAVPEALRSLVGDALFDRVPESYLRASFASQLAASFVYEMGLDGDELSFYRFVRRAL